MPDVGKIPLANPFYRSGCGVCGGRSEPGDQLTTHSPFGNDVVGIAFSWSGGYTTRCSSPSSLSSNFVSTHPFNDGNGRMDRLLTLVLLYRSGYTVGKYVSIEKETERTKEAYYEALAASSVGWQDGENDYTPFVTYMLGVMTACYKELDQRFALALVPGGSEGVLHTYFGQLVGAATKNDILDVSPSLSKRTVERVLKKLQDEGFIEKVGAARSTAYRRAL